MLALLSKSSRLRTLQVQGQLLLRLPPRVASRPPSRAAWRGLSTPAQSGQTSAKGLSAVEPKDPPASAILFRHGQPDLPSDLGPRDLPKPPGKALPRRMQSEPQSVHTRFDPKKLMKAISKAWEVSNKYAIEDFESALLVVVGQQSAGKTTFVERYLKFAFSKVAQGLATRRPSVLTLFPGKGTLIKVVEELPSGEKSEEKTFQGDDSVTKLHEWMREKNDVGQQGKQVVKERLFITICTQECDTPRRIMDLPGLRAAQEKGFEGVNEMILAMVGEAVQKTNTVVVCLADADQDPATNAMFGLFAQKDLNIGLDRRFLVLTKSDKWFASCAPENLPERIKARMEECDRMEGWQSVKPLVVGYTHKLDESSPGRRTQQYKDANREEDDQLADLCAQVSHSQDELQDFWARCGFSKVQPVIEQRALKMDKSLLVNMINQLSRHEVMNMPFYNGWVNPNKPDLDCTGQAPAETSQDRQRAWEPGRCRARQENRAAVLEGVVRQHELPISSAWPSIEKHVVRGGNCGGVWADSSRGGGGFVPVPVRL
ncbi:unnamed protein product [Effrenium voratum]|nr:unnamed protein product [Effrenium voratum]